ncbi:DUF262 domain-containing protein [Bacteroides faecium]|uniref:DUF262 domain-containing protein n=1 Tax=Bacteroides faecium TaxID=2715212 RepID=A0A6H0KTB1_9BACE|nr:DUF262 domain-containing protein [Bacteroides faecium]QIU96535.1 DUF262 domain-containing protein [Bacteroides faecium]
MVDSNNISPDFFALLTPEEQKERKQLEELQEELSVENDTEDDKIVMDNPFNPKDIDIKTKTMSMDNIIKRLKEDEIDLSPDFQRNMNLWDPEKQSRLIESLLIKFPLPAFYFDGSDDNKWLVVDGLQRLSALKNFIVDQTLRLTGLEFLEKLNDSTFSELPRTFQRQIEEAEIIAYIINPGTPEDVKFNIFKRINTGGLVLEPQEIRHALNQGMPARFIAELANLEEFKRATRYVISPVRMLDREFVTRFVSFYINDPNDYKPDLDTFMTKSMGQIKNLSEKERNEIKRNFSEAMKCVITVFGKWAFRKVYKIEEKRRPINKALFEVWSVMLAKLNDEQRNTIMNKRELVFERFIHLMNTDTSFVDSITSSTGDKNRIKYRFGKIENLLIELL